MADDITIKIPDIGGATDVDVIEILVKPGDHIKKDAPLLMVESDKASMEIPSPSAGSIKKIVVKVGDKVCEGDVILMLASDDVASADKDTKTPIPENKQEEKPVESSKKSEPVVSTTSRKLDVMIPDIGGATDVDVIEILVKAGQSVEKGQSLVTLEGDKATMDIPAPASGMVETILLKIGDKVAQGAPVLVMNATEEIAVKSSAPDQPAASSPAVPPVVEVSEPPQSIPLPEPVTDGSGSFVSAGPSVRRMARELGVDLTKIRGQGRKSRILKEDVQSYIKSRLAEKPSSAGGFSLPQSPVIDFSKFGDIEVKPLNKIKKLTGVNVHRSWITIPHVTQFDETDITDLEAFRKSESESASKSGYKLTVLAFVVKAVSKALQMFPQFNASLDASGENLIFKHYVNIGIAVETPNGLVVPVIKQVDQLSVGDIALEMARLSQKAREKGISPADMSGGCFTISSLGGIGGTAFTPIVNSPEVAILGLSRSQIKPVYDGKEFKPRLMLPLSMSYDHRVIDGAEAARFTRYIADLLSDIRRVLL